MSMWLILLQKICGDLYHQFSNNVEMDGFVYEQHGREALQMTSRGVQLLVSIRDGVGQTNDGIKLVNQCC